MGEGGPALFDSPPYRRPRLLTHCHCPAGKLRHRGSTEGLPNPAYLDVGHDTPC
jgi:hypothetical protein